MTRRLPPRARWGGLLLAAWSASCTSGDAGTATVARGDALFQSRELSSSDANIYSCATCHGSEAPSSVPARKPGGPLAGVTRRPSFWGGMEGDLLAAINDCRRYFMNASVALDASDPEAIVLYAYLVSLEPGDPSPVAFTVPPDIVDVARGNADAGGVEFTDRCGSCHGAMHTGSGRLADILPILPEDTLASHVAYDVPTQRLIFIEKVRHGGFFGYGGVMAPFSEEVLGDSELGDILEAMGVTGVPSSDP